MSSDAFRLNRLTESLPAAVPFVGPESLERNNGRRFEVRLGANESAFGVSPKAAAAMAEEIGRVSWYADPENFDLREALASEHGVAMEEISVGAGIDCLLGCIVRMTVEAGDPVVTSLGAYPTFNYHVAGFGASLVTVPYREDREDPEALAAKVRETGAPLVYFANPDNPMGTWHDAARVQAFIDALPVTTLLVLDEAYIEFAPDGTAPAIDTSRPNVLRMRTFSKAHGMAGGRVGYAIGHKALITGINKIRNHFEMNRISQVGALASLLDRDFIVSVAAAVEEGRQDYYRLAERLGLAALPSATNFVAIDVGGGDRAREILAALQAKGVFIRMPGVAPLDRCIRVSVGRPEEREIFARAFAEVLEELAGG
jgi:histidinol-phosphate aminotransferase